jgi:diaminopimelate epimerase
MIQFSKFEALGNDFVLIDARHQAFDPSPDRIQRLGHRHRGIGFDQLLILRDSDRALVQVDIFNQDGSVAEQCGNGMRAVALFLDGQGQLDGAAQLDTAAGLVTVEVEDQDRISATLPPPKFDLPSSCPEALKTDWTEQRDGVAYALHYVDLGNPHLVIEVDAAPSPDLLTRLGRDFSRATALPAGANVSLVHVHDRERVSLSVYERGAGPTLACGSGACATAVSLIRRQRVAGVVKVDQPGGRLVIDWQDGGEIRTLGPARAVFIGSFDADDQLESDA